MCVRVYVCVPVSCFCGDFGPGCQFIFAKATWPDAEGHQASGLYRMASSLLAGLGAAERDEGDLAEFLQARLTWLNFQLYPKHTEAESRGCFHASHFVNEPGSQESKLSFLGTPSVTGLCITVRFPTDSLGS